MDIHYFFNFGHFLEVHLLEYLEIQFHETEGPKRSGDILQKNDVHYNF